MQARIAQFDTERMRTLGAVGHDLRTPMTSLRLRAEMVEDPSLRDPMVRTLEEMAVMADGLVSFARSGQEDEAQRRVDITALLQDLCAERGAVWSGGPAACVTGRPVALRRVFGNLIDNALRYAGDAAVSVGQEGASVVVRVTDTGPGIPDDRLAAMFAPFVRGDHSRNTDWRCGARPVHCPDRRQRPRGADYPAERRDGRSGGRGPSAVWRAQWKSRLLGMTRTSRGWRLDGDGSGLTTWSARESCGAKASGASRNSASDRSSRCWATTWMISTSRCT